MRVIYNGIDMQVLEIAEAVTEPVYDESQTDLLYQRYFLSCNVMVNGQAEVRAVSGPPLSYATDGEYGTIYPQQVAAKPPAVGVPGAGGAAPTDKNVATLGLTDVEGTFPVPGGGNATPALAASAGRGDYVITPTAGPTGVTMRILNSRLNQPRGQLWVFTGDGENENLIVRSHDFNQFCDCNNGPLPIATAITKAFGDGGTYFLNFQVQTFVDLLNPSTFDPSYSPLLLSNRFSTTHQINEDGYLTILVEGTAHCRTDLLYDRAVSPDSLRRTLFLAVPAGFVRQEIEIQGAANGASVTYSYADVQQPVNFVAGRYVNATRIEATHRQSIGNGKDLFSGALDAYGSNLETLSQQQFAKRGNEPEGGDRRIKKMINKLVKKKLAKAAASTTIR